MPIEQTQKEVNGLIDNAESFAEFGALERGEMKNKILNLPEEKLMIVREILLSERKKIAENKEKIRRLISEAKIESRILKSIILAHQREKESLESSIGSNQILKDLDFIDNEKKKHHYGWLLAITIIAIIIAVGVTAAKHFGII